MEVFTMKVLLLVAIFTALADAFAIQGYNVTNTGVDEGPQNQTTGSNIPDSGEDITWSTTNTETTTTTTTPTTTAEGVQVECPEDPFIHQLLPHETDCHMFYYCVWGEKVLNRCPGVLHFNNKLQVCDYPNDAECVVYTSSTTSPTTTVLEESNETLSTLWN